VPFKLIRSNDSSAPIIQCGEEEKVLKAFFETEIQDDAVFAQHLLDLILASGCMQNELSGNLYNILIFKKKFTIENLFDDDETFTGNKTFLKKTLQQWLSFIDQI